MPSVDDCQIITLPKVASDRGSLSFVEANGSIPFDIKRIYTTYDIPTDAVRGGHSHIEQHELVIAVNGSFEIELDDGKHKKTIFLRKAYEGLHIVPGMWRELKNFSSGSVVLVMASDVYKESDYIRDYELFRKNR
ncbi:MAG: WxcM-like domain-containing protein [Marinilabiliaceae bacterium]|nr:WxcM-like domain-containing protein [Marinilabiliaceae bacterium]